MGKALTRPKKPIPPLEDGDRLTADEFLRRYEADRTVERAELINGVVYVNARKVVENGEVRIVPPISGGGHSVPQGDVIGWARNYTRATPGVVAGGPATIKVSGITVPEPDAVVRIDNDHGGNSTLESDDYYHGPPELVVEIAKTTAALDLGPKYDAYEAAGIQEYLVWRTTLKRIDWFELRGRKYVPIVPESDGAVHSRVLPGLWLDVTALASGDFSKVCDGLQLGLASPEHAAFVAKLKRRAARKRK
jgi:Uma2 family endonuclease